MNLIVGILAIVLGFVGTLYLVRSKSSTGKGLAFCVVLVILVLVQIFIQTPLKDVVLEALAGVFIGLVVNWILKPKHT